MKLTKSEFKEMLKECILELVSEGKLPLGQLTEATDNHHHHQYPQRQTAAVGVEQESYTENNNLNQAVKATAMAIAKGNARQASMFEKVIMDTAMTTLQEKLLAERSAGGGGGYAGLPATPEQKELDQAQLNSFAGKNIWAKLAFGGKKPG